MNELSVLNVLFQKVMHSPGFKRAYWSLKLLNFMNCDQSSSLWTNCRILLESLWVNETQLRHLRRISELRGFTMSRMSKVFRISSKNGPLVLKERFFVFFLEHNEQICGIVGLSLQNCPQIPRFLPMRPKTLPTQLQEPYISLSTAFTWSGTSPIPEFHNFLQTFHFHWSQHEFQRPVQAKSTSTYQLKRVELFNRPQISFKF